MESNYYRSRFPLGTSFRLIVNGEIMWPLACVQNFIEFNTLIYIDRFILYGNCYQNAGCHYKTYFFDGPRAQHIRAHIYKHFPISHHVLCCIYSQNEKYARQFFPIVVVVFFVFLLAISCLIFPRMQLSADGFSFSATPALSLSFSSSRSTPLLLSSTVRSMPLEIDPLAVPIHSMCPLFHSFLRIQLLLHALYISAVFFLPSAFLLHCMKRTSIHIYHIYPYARCTTEANKMLRRK